MARESGRTSTRKSVLMLGDDDHFLRACAALDVDVTHVYGTEQKDWGLMAPSFDGTRVYAEDPTSVESVLLALYRAGLDPASFDAIYSTSEGGVTTAAVLGRTFGPLSIAPEVVAVFRDKSLAKACLRDAGVDTARFIVIPDLCDLPADFASPFATAVLKPVAGSATNDASLINSDADLQAAAQRARQRRQNRTYILEEFVPGEEWHADGVVFGGELQFVSLTAYQKTCLTAVTNREWMRERLFDPDVAAATYERTTPLVERVLRILGLQHAVFHMELFYDAGSDRLVFGECAARRGGGFIEEMVNHKFRVSLAEAAVQCALGQPPTIKVDVRPGEVGCAFLPYEPGILLAAPSAAELTELPNVEHALVEWPIGFDMKPMANTMMKVGQVMLTADSREELLRRGDEVVAWFAERTLVVPPGATPRALREWHATAAPGGPRPVTSWKRA